MKDFSYITNSHPAYIESLYNDFVTNPDTVDPEYRKFFEGFDFALSKVAPAVNGATANGKAAANGEAVDFNTVDKELNVYRLIKAYRKKGHLVAKTNPIRERKDRRANLQLQYFNLSEKDLDTPCSSGRFVGMPGATLKEIVAFLEKCYTSSVGVEYTYINDHEKVEWFQNEIEKEIHRQLSIEEKKCILEKLNQGVMFEKFLHTKYIGQKRFSLEGGETTIAGLDAIINTSAELGVQEVVIGMAHRGAVECAR